MLQINFWNIAFTVINLLILYFLVRKFLFKPVHEILEKREQEIQKQYADAAEAEKAANEMKQQMTEALEGLDQEKAQRIDEAKKKANAEYDRIVSSANEEYDKIVNNARDKAKAAAEEEKRKADDEIVAMVRNAANKIVEAESDEKLYDTFLARASEDDRQ